MYMARRFKGSASVNHESSRLHVKRARTMTSLKQAVMVSARLDKIQNRSARLFVWSMSYNSYPLVADVTSFLIVTDRARINE